MSSSANPASWERTVAPSEYSPLMLGGLVYDDEVCDMQASLPWRRFFLGGSSRSAWIRTDQEARPHIVEQTDLSGTHTVSGPDYQHDFANPYDAFWTGDHEAGEMVTPDGACEHACPFRGCEHDTTVRPAR